MNNQYEHYSMEIQWSVPQNTYIVKVPELPGCEARGDTYLEAVKHGREAIKSWIDARSEEGNPIPPPKLYMYE